MTGPADDEPLGPYGRSEPLGRFERDDPSGPQQTDEMDEPIGSQQTDETDELADEHEAPARRPIGTVRKLSGAVMIGMGRALGQIYDPKPPVDIEIEQEAADDQLDPDQPVRIELGDSPASSVARVRRG